MIGAAIEISVKCYELGQPEIIVSERDGKEFTVCEAFGLDHEE